MFKLLKLLKNYKGKGIKKKITQIIKKKLLKLFKLLRKNY